MFPMEGGDGMVTALSLKPNLSRGRERVKLAVHLAISRFSLKSGKMISRSSERKVAGCYEWSSPETKQMPLSMIKG